MKVLLIHDYEEPVGGAEIQMGLLRRELRARGHDARLLTSSARIGVAERAAAGPWSADSLADYRCHGTTSPFRTVLQTMNPWALWRLKQVLSTFRPDVVHVRLFLTQLSPLILPPLRNVPSLHHVVWYRPICPLGTKMLPDGSPCRSPAGRVCHRSGCLRLRDWVPLMLQLRLWRRWRNSFDMVVANSEALRRRLASEGISADEVIHNGAPPGLEPAPPGASPTAVFAGRLVPEKGLDVLVRAFAGVAARVPDARLRIAGEGPERPRIQAMITALGLDNRVELLGHLSRDRMEARFAGAWVQVVPSRWEEPFANAALEAMMRGTAVVASDVGGLPEIVTDGRTGLLAPPGDAEALAIALSRILGDRPTAVRMGCVAREDALERFGLTRSVDAFERLYRILVAR